MSDKDNALLNQFIDTLIRETVTGSRTWKHLSRMRTEKDNNRILYETILLEDEWHRINYEDSFELRFENGFFFLVHERSESGRDGTVSDELNLYIQSAVGAEPIIVANNTPEVYRLRNAIGEIKKESLPGEILRIMTSFINI